MTTGPHISKVSPNTELWHRESLCTRIYGFVPLAFFKTTFFEASWDTWVPSREPRSTHLSRPGQNRVSGPSGSLSGTLLGRLRAQNMRIALRTSLYCGRGPRSSINPGWAGTSVHARDQP